MIEHAWDSRGFSLLVWCAKNFGFSDQTLEEFDWIARWVGRNRNKLVYDPLRCVWKWKD